MLNTFKSSVISLIVPILLLFFWWMLSTSVNKFYLPTPLNTFSEFIEIASNGELIEDILSSLSRLGIGLAISIIPAIILGIIIGINKTISKLFLPSVNGFRVIPITALLPVIIMAFGFSNWAVLSVIFLAAFFPTIIATAHAVENISTTYSNIINDFNLSVVKSFTKILIPGAMPGILTGIDLSINSAFRMMVVSELFGSPNGLGFRLMDSSQFLNFKKIYALMIVIAILGFLITMIFNSFKKYLLRWI